MEREHLYEKFSGSREKHERALFAMLFILQNQIQTEFDSADSTVTLKQFMLLVMIRQGDMFHESLTFTKLGELLGCSRQNIKKLSTSLEKKGFVEISRSDKDVRAACIKPTLKMKTYFDDMAKYHTKKLQVLFQVFDDEELQTLVVLMNKWQEGYQQLKEKDDE